MTDRRGRGAPNATTNVIIIWVASEHEKRALVDDPDSPFCATGHSDGHPSVLVRASRLCEVERDEIVELVQQAWRSTASRRRSIRPFSTEP